MSEREYAVVINAGENLSEIEKELTSSTGTGPIPNRSVDITNARPGSSRITYFNLTDDEATELAKDTRILSVEIPVDQRTDITIGKRSTQISNFTKPSVVDSNIVNWGLKRSILETNEYGNQTTITNNYDFAVTGEGVDVVIQDSGIQANHPEFEDSNGVLRTVELDWYEATNGVVAGTLPAGFYTDYDGHGTHCAGITSGKTYGHAKGSRIFSQKLAGLEGPTDPYSGMGIADIFDCIRIWHNNKPIDPITGYKRPTVVNMSWGYFSSISGNPTSGTYRGTGWTWGVEYSTDLSLWQGTGIVPPTDGPNRIFPIRIPSVDAEIDDMIAAGIHVIIAAGNDYYKGDLSTGLDYNNNVVYGASLTNYHRGSSPHSDNAFIVGSIDTAVEQDGDTFKDKTSGFSSRGPRVNTWAAGRNIISTVSTVNVYPNREADYPTNTDYKVAMISGTSFSAPQVAGVVALHADVTPSLTPAQMKTRIEQEAKNVLYETGSDVDYSAFSTSLMGSPNRMLFNRYGRQPVQTKGNFSMNNITVNT
jgi:subtilisin family serine protease